MYPSFYKCTIRYTKKGGLKMYTQILKMYTLERCTKEGVP
jgi:hypothetical protein